MIRLMGELRPRSEDWSLAEYRTLFGKLNDIAGESKITRYVRFSGEAGGQTVARFFGIETELKDVPDGMIVLEPGENVFRVLQQIRGTVTAWQYALNWEWLNTSVPGRGVGEFKARMPPGWTSRSRQSIEFILTANAYFEKGKTADDDVHLEEYDPHWPQQFKETAAWLKNIIPPKVFLDVEHVGSTAIPGMPAKPVIDVLLTVSSFIEARRLLIPIFNKPEYEYWYYYDHLVFVLRKEPMGTRTHHIHVTIQGHDFGVRIIAFRDYLRAYPEEAKRYLALKRGLAERHADDREAYADAKGEFVKEITDKALRLNRD